MPVQGQGKRARKARVTRRSVKVAEVVSRLLITLGGLGTIAAVTTIFVFLVYVVAPLFQRATVEASQALHLPFELGAATTAQVGTDEYGQIAWHLSRDGELVTVRLETGELLERRSLFDGRAPTVSKVESYADHAVFGFDDGTVVLGRIRFGTDFLPPAELPEGARALRAGEAMTHGNGVLTRLPGEQYRWLRPRVDLEEPFTLGAGKPIQLVDVIDKSSETAQHKLVVALVGDSELAAYDVRRRQNLMTGAFTARVHEHDIPFTLPAGRGSPQHLLLLGRGSTLLLVWEDGYLQRFDLRDMDAPAMVEELDLVLEPGERMTALGMLLGRSTFLSGDSLGRVHAWFEVNEDRHDAAPVVRLVRVHSFPGTGSPVTWISSSQRMRAVAVAHADGRVRLFHVTTNQVLIDVPGSGADPAPIAVYPRGDGLLALGTRPAQRMALSLEYPESTLSSMFLPVWYEGSTGPEHVWQSSGSTDSFEPKLGLYPLIFGTIKATFYSLLFGAPLALMAAIFASEFLTTRLRSSLKSLIEMMASLPSVVLGFLAALVIAPLVHGVIPSILVSFLTIPYCLLAGAYLFQLLPKSVALWLGGAPKLLLILALLAPGIWLASLLGPPVESLLFAGDIQAWLNGRIGGAAGGWVLLLLPVSGVLTALAMGRWVGPVLRSRSLDWSRERCAVADLVKFLAGTVVAIGLAVLLAGMLDGIGFDPRGEPMAIMGSYVQRNALIVGFIMGFAIIPIIYTLAEDALTSVPAHLREASLGAGATQWQTAIRIIIPTAMSGLFSALMIGLGRAVGETMIVLMATGNTPVMEWNVFSGFRTLSANIAVELPEAVKGSAHYRTLFLAALVLFAMTFFVNTLAEVVRQRFRRRAYQL